MSPLEASRYDIEVSIIKIGYLFVLIMTIVWPQVVLASLAIILFGGAFVVVLAWLMALADVLIMGRTWGFARFFAQVSTIASKNWITSRWQQTILLFISIGVAAWVSDLRSRRGRGTQTFRSAIRNAIASLPDGANTEQAHPYAIIDEERS